MVQASPNHAIMIVGGGIGGLSLALGLALRGIACSVFEQADQFSEIGAGLQLSPNAVRRLRELGLETALAAYSYAPEKINIHDGLSGDFLNKIPLGAKAEARYGAPYRVIARRDLLEVLLSALQNTTNVTLETSKKLTHIHPDLRSISTKMADGSSYVGSMLVGADGVWSRVRHLVNPQAVPQQTGFIAWRALIEAADAPPLFRSPDTSVWLGPDAHLVQYRVSGGERINLVAVTKGKTQQRSWENNLPVETLYEKLRGWNKDVRRAVMEIKSWQSWPLMLQRPFQPWSKGRALLMGDAAHAVVPFLAQGAAMAIEDAHALADLIARHGEDYEKIFQNFESERFSRCRRVLSKSIYQAQFYHARSSFAKIRNTGLKIMPSSLLLRQYDWLYKG